eukprot:6561361-Prymnesium_polylepis.2
MPLIVLPLRAVLLEQLPPRAASRLSGTPAAHAAFTVALVGAVGLAATWLADLAVAFEIAGSTAGVTVCFCLPGLLYHAALRMDPMKDPRGPWEPPAGGLVAQPVSCAAWEHTAPTALDVRESGDGTVAVLMVCVGVLSGVVSLVVLVLGAVD